MGSEGRNPTGEGVGEARQNGQIRRQGLGKLRQDWVVGRGNAWKRGREHLQQEGRQEKKKKKKAGRE